MKYRKKSKMTQTSNNLLTKKKEKWVKNRNVTLRGHHLQYNAAQQIRYQNALQDLVIEMTKEVKNKIIKFFKGELAESYFTQQKEAAALDESITAQAKILVNALMTKFQNLFNLKSKSLAQNMVSGAADVSKSSLHSSLKELSGGLSLKTGAVPEGMEEVSAAAINENVALIKSIPQKYFVDISGAVMRSITIGQGLKELVPVIQKSGNISMRRAKLIALDQTRKAYNAINKQRMQAIGVKQFEWIHSGGGRHPRRSHKRMHGEIFSFDNLPIINQEQVDKGYESPQRGIPGTAINCRCTMGPIINFGD